MESIPNDESKQEKRTFLRERFLRLMAALNNQEADIAMYEKTFVSGVIQAMDINVHSLHVSDLKTPMGVLPDATLRLSDTLSITISDFKT